MESVALYCMTLTLIYSCFSNVSNVRSLVRQYWIIALVAFLTWGFHASVNRKFSQMMAGMQEAAALKNAIRMEELILFDDYRRSTLLHLASRQHVQAAFAEEHEAMVLLGRIRTEEQQSSLLHDEAIKLKDQATKDEQTASDLDYASIGDNLDYISSKLKGTAVEKRAEDEAAEANERLAHADELEKKGTELLHQAEAKLNSTGKVSEVVASNQGVCRWISWACDSIDRNAPPEPGKKVSDEAVAIAADFDDALKLINQATNERKYATSLLHKSMKDVNESIAILESANRFRENAEEEHHKAVELHDKAKKEDERAKEEEIVGELEEEEAVSDRARLVIALNAMSHYVVDARAEAEDATALDYERKEEQEAILETETRVRSVTFAAKKHVAHAGWYALMAVLLAIALVVLSFIRIVKTCQTSGPWMWLVRKQKLSKRDVSYVYLHFLILLLTMAFSGQLLYDYHRRGNLARIEIVALFALAGSIFQVTLLHFVPNLIRLVSVSSLNVHTFFTLLVENVVKSGIVVFAVFVLELLLCWVNLGTSVFSHVYKLNGTWLWCLVAIAGTLHVVFLENHREDIVDSESGAEGLDPSNISTKSQGTELRSLMDDPTITPSSSDAASVGLGSMSSISNYEMNYGSTMNNVNVAFSSEISSTFISSWTGQLIRLAFLFDILLASWAVWIARHNVAVILKISPLSPRIVWGFFPLWMLDVVLAALFGVAIYLFCKWKKQKQQNLSLLPYDGAHLSSSPLLG